jgi:glycosyltransferase involved in cell wall biosynthesis
MNVPSEAGLDAGGFKPLVSIVIPVYNGADFLAEAIQSALDQTYSAIEIIVVNDGSTDNGASEAVARTFGSAIRYFSKENGGVASALNLAIQEMTGDYFSWLSHDDLYANDKISQQVKLLSGYNARTTIVYADYSIFTDNRVDKAVSVQMPGVRPEHFRYWIASESALHGCSLLIPKSAFDTAGLFKESLRTTQDYELWFRMANDYQFIHLPQALVRARSHADQDTRRMADVAFKEAGTLYLGFVKAMQPSEFPGHNPTQLSASYLRLASGLWQRGFSDAAAHCAGKAREQGASFVQVHGAHVMASSVRALRQLARLLFSPQARQVIRRYFARLSAFR